MSKYESWKGASGIRKAEACERELHDTLGRWPTKRDFRKAGRYNVWIALYRYRRRSGSLPEKEIERRYYDVREGLLKSKRLMGIMVKDVCSTLGPGEVEDIAERFKEQRGT